MSSDSSTFTLYYFIYVCVKKYTYVEGKRIKLKYLSPDPLNFQDMGIIFPLLYSNIHNLRM